MQLGGPRLCNRADPDHAIDWIPFMQLGGSGEMQFSTGNGSKVDRAQEHSPVDFQTHVIEISPEQFKGMFFADGVEHVLDFTLTSAEEMHIALLRAVQNYYRHRI